MSGCIWLDDFGDYQYSTVIFNSTSDFLVIVHGSDDTVFINGVGFIYLDTINILPLSETQVGGGRVNKGEDPKREVLDDGYRPFNEQTRIYRGDSLVANWIGPFSEMQNDIHHFYNYNSWETWLEDNGYNGVVKFTIYESDLEN